MLTRLVYLSANLYFVATTYIFLAEAYEIGDQVLARSILNYGDSAMYGHIVSKLQKQECMNIAIIGGSVSIGQSLRNISQAYPVVFEQLVNQVFPCDGWHNLTAFTKGATASDYWIDYFVGHQEVLLKDMDLIIVDTAANDIHELVKGNGVPADPSTIIRTNMEILSSLLLQKSIRAAGSRTIEPLCAATRNYNRTWTGAAVLWLATTTRRTALWRSGGPRTTDAVHKHLPVAFIHGVPYVSIIDGLGPFGTAASQAWLNSTWFIGPVLDFHPSAWGHQVLAEVLIHFLRAQQRFAEELPWRDPQPAPYCPRPPVFVDQGVLDMYLDTSPLHIVTVVDAHTAPRMKGCEGWEVKPDVPNKPGLLTERAGSKCTIVAFPDEFRRHAIQVGEAHVILLKSYEHMGVVRVSVSVVPSVLKADGSGDKDCDVGAAEHNVNVLGSTDINCLWGERVSEPKVEVFKIRPFAAVEGVDVCLAFTFQILESGRHDNKIKIVAMSVF